MSCYGPPPMRRKRREVSDPLNPPARGWPLSVPLQLAELRAVAAQARREGSRARLVGAALVVGGGAVGAWNRWAGAAVVLAGGHRLVAAVRLRRRVGRAEARAIVVADGARSPFVGEDC
jgi:hypothetical protein